MFKVKILGAGSIGNHLGHASRSMGWKVDLCDIDEAALERTRTEIYPGRYGAWDKAIRLFKTADAPIGGYDLICVGTPPDSHVPLAMDAVKEKPKAVLVEKPLCTPDLAGAQELFELAQELGVAVFTGYDHVVGDAARQTCRILESDSLGKIATIDVEFREHWGGIFNAHPWLDGPQDSYLGFWRRSGGASGEHSHAANLWQHFAHACGAGRIVEVSAHLDFVSNDRVDYDRLCLATVVTESGMVGRIVQDVVTRPPRKWARVQGEDGFVEWHCGYKPGCDSVIIQMDGKEVETATIEKTRPDDFIRELQHIEATLSADTLLPDISIERGLDTMLVIAAMHRSSRERRAIRIDYAKGYSLAALAA